MGEDSLCNIAVLSIEMEHSEKNKFDDVVDQFSTVKKGKFFYDI